MLLAALIVRSCSWRLGLLSLLSPWLEYSYSVHSHLLFGPHTILSCCGVQQGDPQDPLAFSLLLHPIVQRISREVPNILLHGWYLDDGVMCGTLEDLHSVLRIIEEEGPRRVSSSIIQNASSLLPVLLMLSFMMTSQSHLRALSFYVPPWDLLSFVSPSFVRGWRGLKTLSLFFSSSKTLTLSSLFCMHA